MSNLVKALMLLEIGGVIYLLSLAARAEEQEWRYKAKKAAK